MVARAAAWATAGVHLAVIVWFFVGAPVAARWRRWVVPHAVVSVAVIAVFAVGWDCPLTVVEKWLLRAGEHPVYEGGFIDHYLTGPAFGTPVTPAIRTVALSTWAVLTVWGYGRLVVAARRDRTVLD